MAKNYFKLLMVTLSLALFAGFMSCNTEDVDYVPAEISVMPSVIEFEAGVDTPPSPIMFDVEASRSWTAEFSPETAKDWLSLNVMKGGAGTTKVTAMALPNTAELSRDVIVKFSIAGAVSTTLNVTQKGTKDIEPIGKLILKESFGEGATKPTDGQWPLVGEWTGYLKEGSGVANVAYTGANTSIRVSTASTGYPGATGQNNLFFGALPNDFVISKIDVTGESKLTLKFGVSSVGTYPAMDAITASTIKLQGSLDGTAWTDLTFSNDNTANWVLATSEFEVPAGSTELYLKLKDGQNSLNAGSTVRVDDISLYAGGAGGTVIGGGGPGPEPTGAILKESFGEGATKPTGGQWPLVGEWAEYSKEGSGMANVTYTGANTSIRVSTASTGYPGASAANNLFFGALPNDFVISKIDVTGKTKLTFKFGVSSVGTYPAMDAITASTIKLQGSLDGTAWTDLTFTNANTVGWVLATSEFEVPAGSTELYLKLKDGQNSLNAGSTVRVDDMELNVGTIGGTVIGGGGPGPEPTDAILKESFGEGATKPTGGQWPLVGEWAEYSKEGSGMANVTYTGANTSIRVSTASTGYPGASAANNLFFGALPNDFVISKIDVTGKTKLTFKFGVSSVGTYPAMDAITASTIKLQGSLDGTAWTDLTFTNANTVGWVLATSEFEVPAGSTELYLKLKDGQNSLNAGSTVRVDDMELNVGTIGGTVIGGGGPGPEPTDYIYGESFGVPTANTAISSWTGWVTTGTGKANVSYTGSNTTIRKSAPSTGYEGATGEGSVFFAAAPSHFTVAKIDVTGETKLTLKFGISDNSGVAPTYMSPVSATTVKVQGSLDGIGWTALTYTNSADLAWVIATSEFQVPAGTTELYLKFEDGLGVAGASKVRIDDIILSKGTVGGTEIGVALPEVKKTIAELRALSAGKITDNIYVTGFVIGQTNSSSKSNLIIQDATGGIMFRESSFGDFSIFAEGDEVKVKLGNANMTEYEGLKQVGLLVAAVSKTGTNTAQTPKAITAAELITGSHESQLVSVADVQVIAADLSKTMDGVIDMESLTGETFNMYTSINATFKDAPVPTGSGVLSGVAGVNSGVYQIIPQITTDFSGLTGARFGGLSFATPEFVADLKVGTAIVGDITLQYFDALGTESYNIDVAVSGVGSAGITVASIVAPLTLGSGTITIPVTGTPTTIGAVEFTISGIAELTTTVVTATVLPSGGANYESNVSLPAANNSTLKHYIEKANIEGTTYDVLKLGTSSVGGSYTTDAMGHSGTVTLKLYGVAWTAKAGKITITVNGGGTINGAASVEQAFVSNTGAAANTPYTITFEASDFYSFTLADLTPASTLTFASPSSAPRVIMTGIRVE